MEENKVQKNPEEPQQQPKPSTLTTLKDRISKLPVVYVVGAGIVVVVLIILVIVFASNSLKPSSSKVAALVESGNVSLRKANYPKAQKDFGQAYAANRNDPTIQAGLINSFSFAGNQNGAEQEELKQSQPVIEYSVKTNPQNSDVLTSAGYAYETAGDYQKALDYYKKALQVDPNSATTLFHIGHTQEFLGKKDEAYASYDKAYQADPSNPLVLMARGNQLMSKGDTQGAYESFLEASNSPDINNGLKAEALTGAASARAMQNNYAYISETLQLSKEAVDTVPNFSPALANYGYTLYLTTPTNGNKDQAFEYLKKAIEANPRISKNYLTLSKFYRVKGDYPNAISYNKQAIDKVDDDNTIPSAKAQELNKGDYEYELAKTYYLANQRELVMPNLINAIKHNPFVKETIRNDFANGGQFTDFATNGEFIALIGK